MKRGKNEVETCRLNGWTVGTRLAGDDNGFGATLIRITAIGEKTVLAVCESHSGQPRCGIESTYTFTQREWTEIPS